MKTLIGCIGIIFCASSPILAERVALTPSADTTLFENFPDHNLGRVTSLAAGTTAHDYLSRALIKFDVASQIPANVTIVSARLRLNVVRLPLGPQPSNFFLHRVLRDWGEGDKSFGTLGEPAAEGQASWNNRFHSSASWQTPGGGSGVDFSTTVSSFSFVSDLGTNVFDSSAEMVADVQSWLGTPSQNFGWMLIAESEDVLSTARRFGAKEDTNNAPMLEIEYAPSFRIDSVGRSGETFNLSFAVEPLFTYTVESRPSLSSGSWGVLTNFTETLNSYEATISDTLADPHRFYRVLKAPCNCQ